jgi:hypothetical protein
MGGNETRLFLSSIYKFKFFFFFFWVTWKAPRQRGMDAGWTLDTLRITHRFQRVPNPIGPPFSNYKNYQIFLLSYHFYVPCRSFQTTLSDSPNYVLQWLYANPLFPQFLRSLNYFPATSHHLFPPNLIQFSTTNLVITDK